MKMIGLAMASALFFATAGTTTVHAQQTGPAQGQCVQIVEGIQVTLKKLCHKEVFVTFTTTQGQYGSVKISPGLMQDTGVAIGSADTVQIYACEIGYVPVDTRGDLITKMVSSYLCRRR